MDRMNLGRGKLGRVGGNGGRIGSKSRKELLAL